MKSILDWKEEDVLLFFKRLGLSNSTNLPFSGLTGVNLLKLSNRELKEDFKLKLNERHALLSNIKKEELNSSKLYVYNYSHY